MWSDSTWYGINMSLRWHVLINWYQLRPSHSFSNHFSMKHPMFALEFLSEGPGGDDSDWDTWGQVATLIPWSWHDFPIFSYIFLYFPLFSYIFLYVPIFSYIFLYFSIFSYIFLYFPIFSYIFLYFPIFFYIFLYVSIFSYVFHYFPIGHFPRKVFINWPGCLLPSMYIAPALANVLNLSCPKIRQM